MQESTTIIIESRSVDATIEIGAMIGKKCGRGDIICLDGDLGAGKTHFVKGIAKALGIPSQQISSPTFTLIAEHHNGNMPLYHMDAYRIKDVSELGPIGFDDYVDRADGILVIEWSQLIESALPSQRLHVTLARLENATDFDSRRITLEAFGMDAARQVNGILQHLDSASTSR